MPQRKDQRSDSATRRKFLMTSGAALLAGAATGGDSSAEEPARSPSPRVSGEKTHIVVPEKEVEVLAETDVLVCGGGPAGVAAACSASRGGAKTVLIERWPFLGGMGTAALVNIWHLSDRQKIVIRGFAQQAVERAEQRN